MPAPYHVLCDASHMSADSWSESIQGVSSLDLSRELRFRDDRADLLLRLLGLQPGMRVLDTGCGPGAPTRSIARWLGGTSLVFGVDRDAAFVAHARRRATGQRLHNVRVLLGDALLLPFRDGAFDACASHTLIEHVPHGPFLREQRRVCTPGGRVSVMMVRPEASLVSAPKGVPEISERERELWAPLERAFREADERHGVGAYWPGLRGLPRVFEDVGFRRVQVDAVALPVVPDDARNTRGERRAIVEAEQREVHERLEMATRLLGDRLAAAHLTELRRLIDDRYARRLSMADEGRAQWDYRVSMVLIVSGEA